MRLGLNRAHSLRAGWTDGVRSCLPLQLLLKQVVRRTNFALGRSRWPLCREIGEQGRKEGEPLVGHFSSSGEESP